jgi:hypothetical protein
MDLQVLEKLSWVEKRYLDAAFREIEKNMVLQMLYSTGIRNF